MTRTEAPLARLIYSTITSVDGYVADSSGSFEWGEPDEEVHSFINDTMREIGTHLYGRRMYEVLVAWETMELEGEPDHIRDFATMWRAADKIVYSQTLSSPSSARTRVERDFDLVTVRRLKASAQSDLLIAGPELASFALDAGLVDEYHAYLSPVALGGGKSALPARVRLDLELVDERRFGDGTVFLRYLVTRAPKRR
jgi:dihydrofolate reductase